MFREGMYAPRPKINRTTSKKKEEGEEEEEEEEEKKKKVESKKKIGRNKGGSFHERRKMGEKGGMGEDQFQTICRTISLRFWIRVW